MIARLRSWFSARRRVTKLLLGAAGLVLALAGLYVASRTVQYVGASRTPAGLFVPENADVVVRVADLAGRWNDVQKSDLWKNFTKGLRKDPGVRKSLNEILGELGAPTLDQLEDRRWLERNPLMQEASILRYAGRDLVLALNQDKFCVATRIGPWEFLLLPALQLFPQAIGSKPVQEAGAPVLKRGNLFISVQGAIVVVSNDGPMLASALQRRGKPESTPGLARVTANTEPLRPILRGFPLGALFAIGDVEACRRIQLDIEIKGADLVFRAVAEGLSPRRSEPAPVETVGMIPANGIGAGVTNLEMAPFWDWAQRIGDRRARGGSAFDKIARESFGEYVEILASQRFPEEMVPRLDGPVSLLFGASQGEDGKTYAAIALYARTSQPREAGEALQGIIDRATNNPDVKKRFKPNDEEAGGITFRSYRFDPDPFRLNNYMAICYAVTGDALIIANNRGFLEDALQCRANEERSMAVQHYYEQAIRRLQELGLKKVMAPGASASFFLYGPAIRQGLEGFYGTLASKIVDTPRNKTLLRQELETAAAKEGHPLKPAEVDDHVRRVLEERIHAKEEELRGQARILDFLKWVAFQAEPVNEGLKLEFAIELK